MNKKTFFIIDGHSLIYRSYFAFKNENMITKNGFVTSAIYGFVNSILELIKKEKPDYIAVAFDTKHKTWRHDYLKEYKANRPKQPEDISKSFPIIFEILEGFNIKKYSLDGFEADDVIGTISKKIPEDIDVFIMTPDKDYDQLVKNNVYIYKPNNKGYIKLGINNIVEKWNITEVKQVIDMLAIIGDKCDNVIGVKGIGPKTASKLIKEYSSLENILDNIDTLKENIKNKFIENIEAVKLSKKLVTITTDCNINFNYNDCETKPINTEKLTEIFDNLEFKNIKNKLEILNKYKNQSLF